MASNDDDNPFAPPPRVPHQDDDHPFAPPPRLPPEAAQGPPIFEPAGGKRPRTQLKVAIAIGFLLVFFGGLIYGAKWLTDYIESLNLDRIAAGTDAEGYWEEAASALEKDPAERDYQQIYDLLINAARLGSEEAANQVGVKYEDGVYLYTDSKVQEAWFLEAAEQGSPWAQYVLGYRYMVGNVFEKDLTRAKNFLSQAVAGGSDEASLYLGGLLFHPKYGLEDRERAFENFVKAGQAGLKEGQYLTAVGYEQGWGGKVDGAKAKYWMSLAVDGENEEALGTIGFLYYSDRFLPRDYAKAAEWYRRAAATNNPQSLYDLASLYETGQGVDQSYEQAMELYRRSAKQGFKPALYALGHVYRYGTFGERDIVLAKEWFEKGTALDHAPSAYMLGRILEQGLGDTPVDKERALELYEMSCTAGERIGCAYAAILRHNDNRPGGSRRLDLVEKYYRHHCNVAEESTQCYNLGCIYALLGRKGEALTALEQAVKLGYDEFDHMAVDEDLDSIRDEPRFKRLTPTN